MILARDKLWIILWESASYKHVKHIFIHKSLKIFKENIGLQFFFLNWLMNLLVNSSNLTDSPSNKYTTSAIETFSQGIQIINYSFHIQTAAKKNSTKRELLKAHPVHPLFWVKVILQDSCILRPPQNWFWCYGLHFHWRILASARDGLMNLLPALAVVMLSSTMSQQKSVLQPPIRNSIRAKYNE